MIRAADACGSLPGQRAHRARWWPAISLCLVLVLSALLRAHDLMAVPAFTDEADEVLRAWSIARGQSLPLVNDDAYIGAFYNYLLAAVLLVTGPGAVVPRALSLLAGVATVFLTARLGSALGGHWVGLVAAALLATNGLHVIINSHVAWSHAVTPLITTASVLAVSTALTRGSGRWLVAGGALTGLALQTHPSVVTLLPALCGVYLLHPTGRRWLRAPWPYLAVAAATLACANLLAYNLLQQPGQALREAAWYDYAYQPKHSLAAYLASWPTFAVEVVRTSGSVFANRSSPAEYLLEPTFTLNAALLLAALVFVAVRRCWPLLLPLVSAGLLLPLFGRQFGFLPGDAGRYLSFLLPFSAVAIAWLLVAGARALLGVGRDRSPQVRRTIAAGLGALGLLAGTALVAAPLLATLRYEQADPLRDQNGALAELVAAIEAAGGGPVFVDEALGQRPLFGGGHVRLAVTYLLELRGVAPRPLRVPPVSAARELAATLTGETIVILDQQSIQPLAPLGLEPLYEAPPASSTTPGGYGAYRVHGAHRGQP